ncbi:MAG: hypothetical protein NTV05_07550 [Acidobacteria bacterium]|nr:hypothetical protein [Acidobacteriota bacterium]
MILIVPVLVLVGAVVVFTGDPNQFFPTIERHLWTAVLGVAAWVSGLFS